MRLPYNHSIEAFKVIGGLYPNIDSYKRKKKKKVFDIIFGFPIIGVINFLVSFW